MKNLIPIFNNILQSPNTVNIIENGVNSSNKHYIKKSMAQKWIKSQKNPRIKRTTKALIDTHIYISHHKLVEETLKVIKKFLDRYNNKNYYLLTEREGKSGFMMSLMWLHLTQKYNLKPPSKIISKNEYPNKSMICVNFNDMDYTGNQRDAQMGYYSTGFDKSNKYEITYVVIRVFNSERSVSVFFKTRKRYLTVNKSIKYELLIGNIIPNVRTSISKILKQPTVSKQYYLSKEDYSKSRFDLSTEIYRDMLRYWYGPQWEDINEKPEKRFTNGPFTNVFFDHKVADPISSFSYVFMLGLVPTLANYIIPPNFIEDWGGECFLDNSCIYEQIIECNEDIMPCVSKKSFKTNNITRKDKFFDLINLCDKYHQKYIHIFIHECKRSIRAFTNFIENDTDRCPSSWYKQKWFRNE